MKQTLALFVVAANLALPALAAGPSEASALAVGSAAIALSAMPVVVVSGVARVIDKSFTAVVVGVSAAADSLSGKKVEARTATGEQLVLTVPADAVQRTGVKPGSRLVGEKGSAGLVISADGKPLAIATPDGAGAGLSKNKAL